MLTTNPHLLTAFTEDRRAALLQVAQQARQLNVLQKEVTKSEIKGAVRFFHWKRVLTGVALAAGIWTSACQF
jgi:hypothetical protein